MDKNVENTVRAVIDDLKHKIEEISVAADQCDASVKQEAFQVRDKAVNALNGVITKVGKSISKQNDPEEVYKSLTTVIQKSKTLYNNAINKIGKLGSQNAEKKRPLTDDIESGMESIFDHADGLTGYAEGTERKSSLNNTGFVSDSMDRQAVEILRSWLSPGGEKK